MGQHVAHPSSGCMHAARRPRAAHPTRPRTPAWEGGGEGPDVIRADAVCAAVCAAVPKPCAYDFPYRLLPPPAASHSSLRKHGMSFHVRIRGGPPRGMLMERGGGWRREASAPLPPPPPTPLLPSPLGFQRRKQGRDHMRATAHLILSVVIPTRAQSPRGDGGGGGGGGAMGKQGGVRARAGCLGGRAAARAHLAGSRVSWDGGGCSTGGGRVCKGKESQKGGVALGWRNPAFLCRRKHRWEGAKGPMAGIGRNLNEAALGREPAIARNRGSIGQGPTLAAEGTASA